MILLDTHVILWLAQTSSQLSRAADHAIRTEREHGQIAIAGRSLWEIAFLEAQGRVLLDRPLLAFLLELERQFQVLPVTSRIADQSVRFSADYPSDSSDRIIGATAVIHGLTLVTRDAAIRASGEVSCIW